MTTQHETDWLSIRDACRLLKVSRTTIHRWLKEGRMRAYRVGPKAVRIRRADLDVLLKPVHEEDRHALRASAGTSQTKGPMSLEQFKQTLATPPTPEELARRQAVIARTLAHREDLVITPLTTADVVHQARQEEYEAYGRGR